jgi:hypothetical protein
VGVEEFLGRFILERRELQVGWDSLVQRAFEPRWNGRQENDAIALEPPGNEGKEVRCASIQPMCVLHEDQNRFLPCGFAEQIEGGSCDGVELRRCDFGTERCEEDVALRGAESVDFGSQGSQKLMQARKRDVYLSVGARGPQHGHAALHRNTSRLHQQRCFADSGFTAKHGGGTAPLDVVDQTG